MDFEGRGPAKEGSDGYHGHENTEELQRRLRNDGSDNYGRNEHLQADQHCAPKRLAITPQRCVITLPEDLPDPDRSGHDETEYQRAGPNDFQQLDKDVETLIYGTMHAVTPLFPVARASVLRHSRSKSSSRRFSQQ